MKKLLFVTAGAATLALAACSVKNEDSVQNAEVNQPAAETNDMSGAMTDNAANAEAAALGTQQQQLESENASAPVQEETTQPTDEDEQNVSGM